MTRTYDQENWLKRRDNFEHQCLVRNLSDSLILCDEDFLQVIRSVLCISNSAPGVLARDKYWLIQVMDYNRSTNARSATGCTQPLDGRVPWMGGPSRMSTLIGGEPVTRLFAVAFGGIGSRCHEKFSTRPSNVPTSNSLDGNWYDMGDTSADTDEAATWFLKPKCK